jgi:predicted phage terminase large subunit-like protein
VGTNLIQDLRHEGKLRPIPITPDADKITRMSAQSAKIEAGHVYLPEQAPWLADFMTELLQFPYGRHDDQVDSVSQFLNWTTRPRDHGPQIRRL